MDDSNLDFLMLLSYSKPVDLDARSVLAGKDANAMLMVRLHRDPSQPQQQWILTTFGKGFSLRSFAEIVPPFQELCRDIFPDILVERVPLSIQTHKQVAVGLGWDFGSSD
eukprot:TRINITY_DN28405_c0_g1_i1.p1 TRINITY_DN28405_c0_g1~~TRINITY_DN28405_c0_g1_i1.p1  ORF type:complete len:110 (+),score=20.80 TRINITY_DN28405_c0_g1_i1:57-386(+)